MKHYALNNESICGAAGELTNTPEDITCPDCKGTGEKRDDNLNENLDWFTDK